ncbi:MAG: hypothetical protein ACRDPA_02775 [Solirubrobacteraceae bacterium]
MAVERVVLDRFAVERLAVLRALVRDDPELAFDAPVLAFAVLAFAVLAFDREFDFTAAGTFCVSAVRTLSKSLSACLLVFAASRRSDAIADVTSL